MPLDQLLTTRSLQRAAQVVLDRRVRLVGWGTGSVFDYFHRVFPVRLEYLVDNDARRWGRRRNELDIAPPDRLHGEPGDTFVIIYSGAWPEIQQQLVEIGVPSLPASAMFAGADVRTKLAWAEQLAAHTTSRTPRAENAVVVQGPVVPATTAHVLRVTRALHPHDLVVLSTWVDTPPARLAEAAPLADDVVLSRVPTPGIQNRNCQIVSTRAGIERAAAHGARTILKVRTDLAVLARQVFHQARWWLDCLGSDAARSAGLRGRLIVPASFTRKYLLYHPSDMVMLGDTEDMLRYWSAPLDARSGSLLSTEWVDQSLAAVSMSGHPTESYLGLAFCRALGRPVEGTVPDSWAFYRDLFAVVDNDWLELLWYKNLSIPDVSLRHGLREVVSQNFWRRLHVHDPSLADEMTSIDPHAATLGDVFDAA